MGYLIKYRDHDSGQPCQSVPLAKYQTFIGADGIARKKVRAGHYDVELYETHEVLRLVRKYDDLEVGDG